MSKNHYTNGCYLSKKSKRNYNKEHFKELLRKFWFNSFRCQLCMNIIIKENEE